MSNIRQLSTSDAAKLDYGVSLSEWIQRQGYHPDYLLRPARRALYYLRTGRESKTVQVWQPAIVHDAYPQYVYEFPAYIAARLNLDKWIEAELAA